MTQKNDDSSLACPASGLNSTVYEEDTITQEEYYKGDKRLFRANLFRYGTVLSATMVQFVLFGMMNNISTIRFYWYENRQGANAFLDQTASVNFGFLFFCSLLAFYLIDKIGPARTFIVGCFLVSSSLTIISLFPFPVVIFLFYGVVVGTGASLILFSLLFELKVLFKEELSIVNGIVSCGSCIGTLVQSQFVSKFCANYGWKMLFQSYSIIIVLMMMFGFVFHMAIIHNKKNTTCKKVKDKKQGSAFFAVLKNFGFMVFTFACFVFCLGYMVLYMYMDAFSQTRGVDAALSRTLIGYFSIGSLFGRLSLGVLANYIGIFRICFFCMGVLNVISNLCFSFSAFVFYSIVLGYFDGGYVALVFPAICDMVRKKNQACSGKKMPDLNQQENKATSVCYITQGVALIVGQVIINSFMPYIGEYSNVFSLSGIIFMTSSMILAAAPLL